MHDAAAMRRLFCLDPETTFLNHGSFGACPRVVLDRQNEWRARLEAEPVRFFVREAPKHLDEARAFLGAFIGADAEHLVWVPNATTGVNTVLRSLDFSPGDEILVTDQEYNACRNAIDFVAQKAGAKVVVAHAPFPCDSADDVLKAILGVVTPKTKFALVDHITSQTGVIFPLERLVAGLRSLGVITMVDGAHAPGMVALNLDRLGADFYTGNLHKWVCAPKGAAFLYVPRVWQSQIRPLVISHGANATLRDQKSRFRVEFEWLGTDDPTPFLCVPDAIRFMGSLMGDWQTLRAHNQKTALEARTLICETLGAQVPCPDDMIGSMAAIALPDLAPGEGPEHFDIDPIGEQLFARKIEIPVNVWPKPPKRWIRLSAQVYNSRSDYERLAQALREIVAKR